MLCGHAKARRARAPALRQEALGLRAQAKNPGEVSIECKIVTSQPSAVQTISSYFRAPRSQALCEPLGISAPAH